MAAPDLSQRPEWHAYAALYRDAGVVNESLYETLALLDAMHREAERTPTYNVLKLVLDRSLALLALVVLSPLLIAVAIAVKVSSPGPILYVQTRAGRFMAPFRIYKFRTMRLNSARTYLMQGNEMTPGMFKMRRDPRLTPIGRLLRRWSIDEMPQLLNVLNGTMSLVGPRPLTLEDSSTIPAEHLLRFAVMPGVTGLWQATARESPDATLKIRLDYEYVLNRSLAYDAKLMLKTVPRVISGIGAW